MESLPFTVGSFNRTFMELKVPKVMSARDFLLFQSHLYGIESSKYEARFGFGKGFNRTFMELKARAKKAVIANKFSFNRTFMELKAEPEQVGILGGTSFNRTFMELKVWCRWV